MTPWQVLECSLDKIHGVMKEAQAVGMMSHRYSFLVTGLDLHMVHLEDFKHGDTRVLGLQLVDLARPEVEELVTRWRQVGPGGTPSIHIWFNYLNCSNYEKKKKTIYLLLQHNKKNE